MAFSCKPTSLNVKSCKSKKALTTDCLRISKVPWKFRIPAIYKFTVFFPWNFLLSFLIINKTLRLINLKIRTATNAKTSMFVICVEVIIYLLLYNLYDCTFQISIDLNFYSNNLLHSLICCLFTIFLYIKTAKHWWDGFRVDHPWNQNNESKCN